MTTQTPNVQPLDVHPLDNASKAITKGLSTLNIRTRSIKFDFLRGKITAKETVTTVEPPNEGH